MDVLKEYQLMLNADPANWDIRQKLALGYYKLALKNEITEQVSIQERESIFRDYLKMFPQHDLCQQYLADVLKSKARLMGDPEQLYHDGNVTKLKELESLYNELLAINLNLPTNKIGIARITYLLEKEQRSIEEITKHILKLIFPKGGTADLFYESIFFDSSLIQDQGLQKEYKWFLRTMINVAPFENCYRNALAKERKEIKQTLKVLDDFYHKDLMEGDVVSLVEGKVRILDMSFRNEFGEFILCEYLQDIEGEVKGWERVMGVEAHPDNPYEVVGSIHVPGYRNLLAGMGFFVRNRELDKIKGFSFQQTWNLLFHEGAENANASANSHNMFHTKLIDSIEGLPSLDSAYWKINAYDESGEPFAPFTDEALREIEKGIKHAARNLGRDSAKNI